jgi:hypothetical protein
MKKVLAILAVVSLVTFASCGKKAQTEEVTTTDSTSVSVDSVSVDTTAVKAQ